MFRIRCKHLRECILAASCEIDGKRKLADFILAVGHRCLITDIRFTIRGHREVLD